MSGDESQRRASGYRTGRMETFSDGVFAIAITLLVLEIAIPPLDLRTTSLKL